MTQCRRAEQIMVKGRINARQAGAVLRTGNFAIGWHRASRGERLTLALHGFIIKPSLPLTTDILPGGPDMRRLIPGRLTSLFLTGLVLTMLPSLARGQVV